MDCDIAPTGDTDLSHGSPGRDVPVSERWGKRVTHEQRNRNELDARTPVVVRPPGAHRDPRGACHASRHGAQPTRVAGSQPRWPLKPDSTKTITPASYPDFPAPLIRARQVKVGFVFSGRTRVTRFDSGQIARKSRSGFRPRDLGQVRPPGHANRTQVARNEWLFSEPPGL